MLTTPLLEAKYKIQKQLAEKAQYDLEKYIENSQSIVREVETKYGFQFKYGALQSGELEPLVPRKTPHTDMQPTPGSLRPAPNPRRD
jgi:hypothetical protein